MHAPLARLGGCADARAVRVEHQLNRFHPKVRPRVVALARRHPWIADLAVSFPALLFALAYPRVGVCSRRTVQLVVEGAPLARIAASAGVAMWLRTFPPQAFAKSIPALPDTVAFRRSIANHLPPRWKDAPRWIENVALAMEAGDEEVALWFAREAPLKPQKKRRFARKRPDNRRLVILWAWFSARCKTAAHNFLLTPWHPGLHWKAAIDAAFAWRAAMALALYLGERGVEDTWLEGGDRGGYTFVALRSRSDLLAEADAMKNCVRNYGASLAGNDTRLWSVRKGGERVATLSLGAGIGPLPYITELSCAHNKEAPLEMWLAARQWLHAQDTGFSDAGRLAYKDTSFDPRVWRTLWRPYWLAKRRVPIWLPMQPDPVAFYDL